MNEESQLLLQLAKLKPAELAKVQITIERQRAHALAKSAAQPVAQSSVPRGWGTWGRPIAAR